MSSIKDHYVGPYRLLRLLATGQTTEIWEAIHDAQRLRVAIKRLRVENPSREQLALLRREHAVAKSFDHPHVIKSLELGESRRETYVVLELYPVPNMKQVILAGVENVAHLAGRIVDEASSGLAYVHSLEWIHRDIKPDNFLVSPEGDVKLIDFALCEKKKTGLARFFAGKSKVQGTPSYMSPEQIRGKSLDDKADIYSFGCTLFELLSGRKAFTGVSPNELLSKHLKAAPPSLEAANRNVTPEFAALVRLMLSKQPAERPDIEQFRRELAVTEMFKEPPLPPGEQEKEEGH